MVEELLEQLIFVVIIVQLNHKRINLLNLMKHVQMLLSLNSIKYPLGILTQLRQLLRYNAMLSLASTRLRPTHHKVHNLSLRELKPRSTETQAHSHLLIHHLLLRLPIRRLLVSCLRLRIVSGDLEEALIVEYAEGLAVHDEESGGDLTW